MTIDKLEIEIESNSAAAAKGVRSLATALKKLKGMTSGDLGLSNVSRQIKEITQDIPALVAMSKVAREVTKTLSSMEAGAIRQVAQETQAASEGMNSLNEATSDVRSGLEDVGTKDVSELVTRFAELQREMKTATALDTPQGIAEYVSMSQEAAAIKKTLRKEFSLLTPQVNQLSKSINTVDVENMSQPLGKLADIFPKLNSKVTALMQIFPQFESVVSSIKPIIGALTAKLLPLTIAVTVLYTAFRAVSGVIGVTFRGFHTYLSALAQIYQYAGRAALAIGEFVGSLARITAEPARRIGAMVWQLTRLTLGLNRFNQEGKQTGFIVRQLRLRAFRTALNSITQGFREGTQAVARFHSVTNAAMSSVITDTAYLRNTFGSLASPLLQIVAPALRLITNLAVTATNAIGQLLSLVAGRGYFVRARRVAQDYAGALGGVGGGAADARRELDNLTGSIDELNILQDAAGGGGGGGTGGGFGDMFETVPIDSAIADFWGNLRNAWNNQDWRWFEDWGYGMAQAIADWLDNIPWDTIRDYARRLAMAISSTINGFIRNRQFWGSIGRTIGNAVWVAVTFASTLLQNTRFTELGMNVAHLVMETVRSLPPKELGQAIADWWNAGIRFLSGIVREMNQDRQWLELGSWVGQAVNTALTQTNWAQYIRNLSGLAIGVLDAAVAAINEIEFSAIGRSVARGISGIDWFGIITRTFVATTDLANGLLTVLKKAVSAVRFSEIGDSIGAGINYALGHFDWGGLGRLIANIALGILDLWNTAVSRVDWELVGQRMKEFLSGLDIIGILGSAVSLIANIALGLLTAFVEATKDLDGEYLGGRIADFINDLPLNEIFTALATLAQQVIPEMLSALVHVIDTFDWEGLTDAIAGVLEAINPAELVSALVEPLTAMIERLMPLVDGIIRPIMSHVTEALRSIVGTGVNIAVDYLIPLAIEVGKSLVTALVDGLRGSDNLIISGIGHVLGFFTRCMRNDPEPRQAGFEVGYGIVAGIGNAFLKTAPGPIGLFARARSLFTSLIDLGRGIFGISSPSTVFHSIGAACIQGLENGITSRESSVLSTIGSVARGLLDRVRSALSISSPSREFRTIGIQSLQGMEDGVTSQARSVENAMRTLLNNIKRIFNNIDRWFFNMARNFMQQKLRAIQLEAPVIQRVMQELRLGITETVWSGTDAWFMEKWTNIMRLKREAIEKYTPPIRSAMDAVLLSAVQAFDNAPSQFFDIGVRMMNSLEQGIMSRAAAIASAAARVVSDAISAAKQAADMNSPSRVFFNIGSAGVGLGLELGILDKVKDVQKASTQLIDAVTSAPSSMISTVCELASGFGGAFVSMYNNVLSSTEAFRYNLVNEVKSAVQDVTSMLNALHNSPSITVGAIAQAQPVMPLSDYPAIFNSNERASAASDSRTQGRSDEESNKLLRALIVAVEELSGRPVEVSARVDLDGRVLATGMARAKKDMGQPIFGEGGV